MSRRHRIPSALAVVVVLAAVLSGCGGPTFTSLPLPGSGVSGKTITLRADFDDALNLAQGAAVRVNGVRDGRVTEVSTHDFKATVTMKVKTSADVRRGATARLRYTTPLGELFVDLRNPAKGEVLADGAHLSRKSTSVAPTVEDALASASVLINGGGLAQLQTITTEANRAIGGREDTVRDLVARLNVLLGQANGASGDIDKALHELNAVALVLHSRRGTIHRALSDIAPASRSVRANLTNITHLLTSLKRFAGTANDVVDLTRDQALALIRRAAPILQELESVRGVLPQTLRALLALSKTANKVIPGDYLNLGAHLDLDLVTLLESGTSALKSASSGSSSAASPQSLAAGGDAGQMLTDLGGGVTRGVAGELLAGLTGSTGRAGRVQGSGGRR